jgi:hypothetical protein
MANADSSASTLRPSKEAALRILERLANDRAEVAAAVRPAPGERRLGSGVYRLGVDEYAGLERLDRAELDETD